MLFRTEEARVREIHGHHPQGILQTYCLENVGAAAHRQGKVNLDPAPTVWLCSETARAGAVEGA